MDNMREVQIGSDLIYEGKILDFYCDTVRLPNGRSATRELVRHNGAVAIVPMLDDGRVIVEDQYRYPHDGVIVEIPAGKLDGPDEDPEEAARRELQEETGYTCEKLIPMGPFYPTAAYSSETIWLYLAKGLKAGEQKLDEGEFLTVRAMPLEDLVRDVLDGKVPDGKTQAAIMRVWAMKNGI